MGEYKPLVSFLIAAYNEEKFIVDCIESCLDQTYPNIEVCVTDDGSTDKTWAIIKEYYQNNPQVKISRFEDNRGKVAAFNNSYSLSQGAYNALLGADDVALTERIDESYTYLCNNRFDLIFGNLISCDEQLNDIGPMIEKRACTISLERQLHANLTSGSTMFFNKKIADLAFPVPATLKFEDWWIGFIALINGQVGHLDKYLIRYRTHSANDYFHKDQLFRLQRDFKRHFAYFEEFKKYINADERFEDKEKFLRIIAQSICHRRLVLAGSFGDRFKQLSGLLDHFAFDSRSFELFLLFLLGQQNIFRIKKMFH